MARFNKGTFTVTISAGDKGDIQEALSLLGDNIEAMQLQFKFVIESREQIEALMDKFDELLGTRSESCEVKYDTKGEYIAVRRMPLPSLTPLERATNSDLREREREREAS